MVFGSMTESVELCEMPEGYVERGDDCNDLETMIHPNNYELCDGVDNNCDGTIDVDAEDRFEIYIDTDNDGFGNRNEVGELSCSLLEGYSTNNDDCDDDVGTINPNTDEICDGIDNDCDDNTDENDAIDGSIWFVDEDNDGFGSSEGTMVSCSQPVDYVQNANDCDDDIDTVNPNADEICDGIDNDCDGLFDDMDEDVLDDNKIQIFLDLDNDGYGDDTSVTLDFCSIPEGYVILGGDCDETDILIHPNNYDELWDGVDNNCDGTIDVDAEDRFEIYIDTDNDGFGNRNEVGGVILFSLEGYSTNNFDCDDDIDTVNPNADEICDGIDNDCDDNTDENDAIDGSVWFVDEDNDGFGSSEGTMVSCSQPVDYVQNANDCDDDIDTVNPNADEICDGIDNDCDGLFDDMDEDVLDDNKIQIFLDSDNDGYGDNSNILLACTVQSGYVLMGGDCDDGNTSAYSELTLEVCDGSDNNCDGNVDEGVTTTFYADNDTDGYGTADSSSEFCMLPESGFSEKFSLICDDSDIDVFVIEGGDSASEHCASPSCETIMNVQDNPTDGVYWIKGSNTILKAIVI